LGRVVSWHRGNLPNEVRPSVQKDAGPLVSSTGKLGQGARLTWSDNLQLDRAGRIAM
jgi:hypothetical protein